MILLHSNSPNVERRECVIYSPANEPFLAGASYFFLLLLHFYCLLLSSLALCTDFTFLCSSLAVSFVMALKTL